jgi:WD40 repeat protein
LIYDETPAATSLAFSPDRRSLIAGTKTGRIMCWDLARRSVTHDWEASPAARQHALKIVDQMIAKSDSIIDSFFLPALAAEWTSVHSVAVSPAGGIICAGTGDSVTLFTVRGKHLTGWTDDREPRRSVSFHGDGQEVAYIADGKLLLRDVLTGRVICQVPVAAELGCADYYAVGYDGTSLAVAERTQVSIYRDQVAPLVVRWHDWRLHMTRPGSDEFNSPSITAISLGPVRDSLAILAFINDHGIIQRWTLGLDQSELLQLAGTGCAGHVVRLMAADQAHLALAQSEQGAVTFWDSRTDETTSLPLGDDLSSERLTVAAADKAGTVLAAAFTTGAIAVWQLFRSEPELSVLRPTGALH